jgi:tRNA(Ile)-lysidine synthase
MIPIILPPVAAGVVAVSGGGDSVALARLLIDAGRPFHVVHIMHGLRGRDSDADAEYVRDSAAAWQVPCALLPGPLTARAGNLEDDARRVRYRLLTEYARKNHLAWIATGHTRDDQAETVLMRLLRGTGIAGLAGIPGESVREGIPLLRPLLQVPRQALREYLNSVAQPFREDASNASDAFLRNRIRRDLLPALESESPDVARHLAELAGQAREWRDMIERLAEAGLKQAELPRAGRVVILRTTQLPAEVILRTEIYRAIWHREGWPLADMTAEHWRSLAMLVERQRHYPGAITLAVRGTVLTLTPGRAEF